ncbi:MAG TPA: response regulator [Burkholderiales bacterium]|nr:response regulator [Burkholderiales bacterium]
MPAPLDAVIANEQLNRRRPRQRQPDGLEQALERLRRDLATSPRRILQNLSDTALELCQAHSAGVSLLESEGERQFFRWHAVSGKWAPLVWTTLPREFSPCGTVLDRNAPQLMIDPERYFTPLAQVPPKVTEALLLPFSVNGELVGTVWAVSHDRTRCFDSEDRRVLAHLSEFAARAYRQLSTLSAEDVVHLSRLSAGRAQKPLRAPLQRRILVVDDNVDAANSLAVLLRGMGHEVFVAHEGRAALADLSRIRPDIALLDIAMPDMSGYELARQIRSRAGPAMRIVALSGFGLAEDRARALEAGFDQHMVKPADPAFLKSLLG